MNDTVDNSQLDGLSLEQLGSLLNGNPAQPQQGEGLSAEADPQQHEGADPQEGADLESSADGQDGGESGQKLTVKDLAEKLGVEPADLYQSVTISLGDREVSLGEFKDRAKELAQSDALLAEATDRQIATENELLQKRQAIESYAKRMGYQPSQEDMERSREEAEQYLKLQQRMAVEAMPDWADETVRHRDEKAIGQLKQEYGFSDVEAKLMVDHRLVKILRDYSRLRDTVRGTGSKKQVSRRTQKPGVYRQSSSTVDSIKSRATGGKLNQDAAISELGKLLR